jgi:NADPH:quinone reductase-like Zn-dependent oxidoreductase
MKAVILTGAGGVDKLEIANIPTPDIKDGEVLIQVKSFSINPVDAKTRAGKGRYNALKDEQPLIIGWDISGVVTQSKSPLLKPGDEVFGMANFPAAGKAYAEYVAVPANQLALKPANITHEEAAAATLAALTALQGLQQYGVVKPGSRVLVTAASGGVGHYAVQIAKILGAHVIGSSSAANRDLVLSLGADEHLDYKTTTLAEGAKDVDFIYDTTNQLAEEVPLLKEGGQLVTILHGVNDEIAAQAAAKGATAKNMLVTADGPGMQKIADWMAQGKLRSVVSERYSMEQIREAHLQIESGRTKGKIVVNI